MHGQAAPTNGTTNYDPIRFHRQLEPTELNVVDTGLTTSIEVSALYAEISAAPGASHSWIFTFRKNGADTGLTVADRDRPDDRVDYRRTCNTCGRRLFRILGEGDRDAVLADTDRHLTLTVGPTAASLATDFDALLVAP